MHPTKDGDRPEEDGGAARERTFGEAPPPESVQVVPPERHRKGAVLTPEEARALFEGVPPAPPQEG